MDQLALKEKEKIGKGIPVLVDKKEHCCGCSACYVKCSIGAIEMQPDVEGFLYPVIDSDKCICCYKCVKVCVFKTDQKRRNFY